jgi:hypothetical protein
MGLDDRNSMGSRYARLIQIFARKCDLANVMQDRRYVMKARTVLREYSSVRRMLLPVADLFFWGLRCMGRVFPPDRQSFNGLEQHLLELVSALRRQRKVPIHELAQNKVRIIAKVPAT